MIKKWDLLKYMSGKGRLIYFKQISDSILVKITCKVNLERGVK